MDSEIERTLRPYSNLKNQLSTIYDHLPYKKDINLVKSSDVRLVSGNVVKNMSLVPKDEVIINTNPLANDRIEKYLNEQPTYSTDFVVEEYNENPLTDSDTEHSPSIENHHVEPENPFVGVNENDDDYSFLLD